MSLDDLKLSPFLVKKLYENTLIASSFAKNDILNVDQNLTIQKPSLLKQENEQHTPTDSIKYLGKNGKNILLLVNEENHTFLGDEELSFLMNILNACNISMADAALVNTNNNKMSNYQNLMSEFLPQVIIFLGIEPQQLDFPVQIPFYQVQQYNKQQYLCAPSLQKLAADKEEKKQLWLCLKKIFAI